MFILTLIGCLVMIDITITMIIDASGMISTCMKCNKKFEGTFFWVIFTQTVHRCEDNFI